MIQRAPFVAAILSAAIVAVVPAWGQTVFRCGSSYSQTPCPGAAVIDASDSRTAEQKAQTDAAATQAGKIADRMERDRIVRERALADRASETSVRAAAARKIPVSKASKTSGAKATKSAPEHFVAAAPLEPKKAAIKPAGRAVRP